MEISPLRPLDPARPVTGARPLRPAGKAIGEFARLVGNFAGDVDRLQREAARQVAELAAGPPVVDDAAADTSSLWTAARTKDYVDSLIKGLDWQDSVIALAAEVPAAPVAGDRYIAAGAPGRKSDRAKNAPDSTRNSAIISGCWIS